VRALDGVGRKELAKPVVVDELVTALATLLAT